MRRKVAVFILIVAWLSAGDPASAVQLFVEVNPTVVRPGEPVSVNLTVANDELSPLTGLELHLDVAEHLDNLNTAYISTGGVANTVRCIGNVSEDLCSSGEVVVWSLGTLPVGDGLTVSLPLEVLSFTGDGTLIPFEAEVWVDGGQVLTESRSARVETDPFFEVTLDKIVDPVGAAGDREYIITYSNVGTSGSGLELEFPLPAGSSFVSATGSGSLSGEIVVWDLGSLAAGEGDQRRVTISMSGDSGDLLEIDPVRLSGTDSGYVSHTVEVNGVTRIEVDERPALALSLSPQAVRRSEPIDVEFTVTNPTTTLMSNVELRLRYPEHLNNLNTSYISTGGAANSVRCIGNVSEDLCSSGEIAVWSLNALPPGSGVTVGLSPEVLSYPVDGTLIQFQAEVWIDGEQVITESRSARVDSDPFFEITLDKIADPVVASNDQEYIFTYSNVGTSGSGLVLEFPLPAGATFVDATDGGMLSAGDVVWDLGSLPAGEGGQQRVLISMSGDSGDLLEFDPVRLSGMDSGHVTHAVELNGVTRVGDAARQMLALSLTPQAVGRSEPVEVKLTVNNPTTALLSNVELHLRYPEHLNNLNTSYISTGGAANTVRCIGNVSEDLCSSGEIAVWNLNTLLPGGSVTVSLSPEILSYPIDGTLIKFQAEVWVDGVQWTSRSITGIVGTAFTIGNYDDEGDNGGGDNSGGDNDGGDNDSGDNDSGNNDGGKDGGICFPITSKSGKMTMICL